MLDKKILGYLEHTHDYKKDYSLQTTIDRVYRGYCCHLLDIPIRNPE